MRRLVVRSSAHQLSEPAKRWQLELARRAERSRWRGIAAPTLVIAGERDTFCTPDPFRETATGIPLGKLRLYPDMGHPAQARRFERDVLAFLRDREAVRRQ